MLPVAITVSISSCRVLARRFLRTYQWSSDDVPGGPAHRLRYLWRIDIGGCTGILMRTVVLMVLLLRWSSICRAVADGVVSGKCFHMARCVGMSLAGRCCLNKSPVGPDYSACSCLLPAMVALPLLPRYCSVQFSSTRNSAVADTARAIPVHCIFR